ncbi:MAG: beta-N-acetylglucosaminidase [Flavobacteriales bacterium]|nr:beta-N-acetylglucosaminidase [Flavobacteriales bacterium]
MFKKVVSIFIFSVLSTYIFSQSVNQDKWVDSVMNNLSVEERIAQLLMVSAYSNKDKNHTDKIESLIKNYKIGGIMFLQGGPVRQAKLTNLYQSISETPLMIALDAEWGISMRLDSALRFPWQMTLGSIQDEQLIYQMGKEIARQCKLIGVNINFAPVVDVNFNPENPIIGNRSFGENPIRVGELAVQYMKGMQHNGVLACAKHFPGHGDTDTDSHKSLPIINHTKERLDTVEILPFKILIDSGLGSVMVAHLYIPELDNTKNQAVSLSPKVVNDLLKEELGFKGMVITDALNMKGVSKFYKPGIVDLKALLAGSDILLFSEDVPEAINQIKLAINNGEITQEEVDSRCRKILVNKYWMGLSQFTPINLDKVKNEVTINKTRLINRKLIENSITLVQNYDNLIPLKRLDTLNIASVCIGDPSSDFQSTLSKYAKVDHFNITENASEKEKEKLLSQLSKYNLVLVGIHKSNDNPWKSYKFSKTDDLLIQKIAAQSKVVVSLFANPYSLNSFLFVNNFDAIVLSYQNSVISQEISAQAIFGGIAIKGKLPVSTKHFPINLGYKTKKIRLGYTIPEEFGVNHQDLYKIDSMAINAISQKATPSCQILIAKSGKILFNKSYGFHTYEKKRKLTNDDVFDLASITKISSSLPMLMKMVDEGKLDIDDSLSMYLDLDTSDKGSIIIKDILSHQARLKSWIPFYRKTLENDTINGVKVLRDTLYSTEYSPIFPNIVAKDIYLHFSYPDTMFNIIKYSELMDFKRYKYSDLGYYFFKRIIEKTYSEYLNVLSENYFYKKLGMENLNYLPLNNLNKDRIVPTELDFIFRSQLIQGYVHDMGAAMQGGVGGHAGVFSNANDLAKLMQMYLNNGVYAEERYINSSTIDLFTKSHFIENENRRGLGFDKPEPLDGGPTCDGVSLASFGHTGFTGTIAWADPETEIVYIFLSNRIHPDSENLKLLKMDVRTEIMKEVYKHFGNKK